MWTGQWYHLKAWPDIYEKKDVVGQLDVSILQEKVLRPVLGIEDPRTDQRISFVGGSHKAAELAEIADRTGGVAFVMYPTSMEDLMKIADENKINASKNPPGLSQNSEADFFYISYSMMPGSKGLNPHELAHRWMKDLGTRPDMSIKVG